LKVRDARTSTIDSVVSNIAEVRTKNCGRPPLHPKEVRDSQRERGRIHLLVSAVGVGATAVHTRVGPTVVALVDVDVAVGAIKSGPAGTAVAVAEGGAGSAVAARLAGAVVRLLTVLA
jgi:hypothetical protein